MGSAALISVQEFVIFCPVPAVNLSQGGSLFYYALCVIPYIIYIFLVFWLLKISISMTTKEYALQKISDLVQRFVEQ